MKIDTSRFNYGVLNALTAQVDDLETMRIAVGNRRRLLVLPRDVADVDGINRGLGLSEDDVLVLGPINTVADGVGELEDRAIKGLVKYMRHSPWHDWLSDPASKGVGAKQLARLLGAIGDPYWHSANNRPRLVSELWSYCGYAVVGGYAPRRRRGQQSNWSEEARKRAWLIAGSCVKSGGHYREVYDQAKLRYADAVHTGECVRCGPAGKPAQPDSPISDGHRHARALRAVSKEVLKDLWRESRRHHGVTDEQEADAA
jgi:hypothetical protein